MWGGTAMSYGVVASKAAEVQVESVQAPGADVDASPSPTVWGSGRLTLTSLHLTFVPTRTSPGVPALTLDLGDVLAVDVGTTRGHRTVHVRTATVALHARVTGAAAFARRVQTSVDANRRRAAPELAAERASDRTLGSEL